MTNDSFILNLSARAPARDIRAFDPTYGYDLQGLLAIESPPAPEDFDSFWERRWGEAGALSRDLEIEQRGPVRVGDRLVSEIYYRSRGGFRVGAWISAPASGTVTRGMVIGHGYGGRAAPDPVQWSDTVVVFPCARGFNLSRHADVSEDAHQHVLVGIGDRDRYILGDCVFDYWLGLSAMLELYPQARQDVSYMGGSFGGGVGAFVVAWDQRIHRAVLTVPSFGGHPLRLQMPCVGSGEAVRRRFHRDPSIAEELKYHDAAFAAAHIRVPVLAGLALYDPAVPPPGQFAVFNALKGPRKLFLFSCGHHDCAVSEKEGLEFEQVCSSFLREPQAAMNRGSKSAIRRA